MNFTDSDTISSEHGQVAEHAWRYFDLHAKQRIALFNFFVLLAALIVAAWAAAMTGDTPRPIAAIILACLLSFFSLIFWKIDQRNSFLTKRAEKVLSEAESELPVEMRLFANEPGETEKAKGGNFIARQWTQGEALRIVFSLMGFVGVLAGVYAFATAVS